MAAIPFGHTRTNGDLARDIGMPAGPMRCQYSFPVVENLVRNLWADFRPKAG
jgi:hypothetical protein